MKRDDFPGAVAHGDAWKYFNDWTVKAGVAPTLVRWDAYLSGWVAKGKQRIDIRKLELKRV